MKFITISAVVFLFLFTASSLLSTSAQEIDPTTLTNIELVTVDEDSAKITWVTNLPSDTKVQWGTTQDLGEENVVSESTNYHMAIIQDLLQGTMYYYRVGSGNSYSDISTFTTLTDPGGDLLIQFAIVADSHYDTDGENTASGAMYEDGPRLLSSAVSQINSQSQIQFVVTTGDITNGAQTDYQGLVSTMNALSVPWYPVLGNWDKNEESWASYYSDNMGRTETYYSFEKSGYHFVILDSAVSGEVGGDIDQEQLDWLEGDLSDNSEKPTLIFTHHMVDRTDEIFGITPASQASLLSILSDNSQVLTVTSGHIHKNIKSPLGDQFNIAVASTVQYPIGYSIVKIYDLGYTQSFHKIESELETSEESRIRLNAASGNPNEDDDYLGPLAQRSFVVNTPGNHPPTVTSIEADPSTIRPRGTTTITVSASDPDGDPLTYVYETSGGTITGSGSEIKWQAPDTTGNYTVSVRVSDGQKNSNNEMVTITVKGEAENGEDDDGISGFETAVVIITITLLGIVLRRRRG